MNSNNHWKHQKDIIEKASNILGSQAELAKRLCIAKQSITRWKNGKVAMGSKYMLAIDAIIKLER